MKPYIVLVSSETLKTYTFTYVHTRTDRDTNNHTQISGQVAKRTERETEMTCTDTYVPYYSVDL